MTAAHDFAVDSRSWHRFRPFPEDIAEQLQQQSTAVWPGRAKRSSDLAWLSETYSLVARHAIDPAVDLVFDHFDELLDCGKFREADEALAAVDVKRLDSNLMVALLTITRAAKDRLRRRADLVRRIEARLIADAPERTKELLAGLR